MFQDLVDLLSFLVMADLFQNLSIVKKKQRSTAELEKQKMRGMSFATSASFYKITLPP